MSNRDDTIRAHFERLTLAELEEALTKKRDDYDAPALEIGDAALERRRANPEPVETMAGVAPVPGWRRRVRWWDVWLIIIATGAGGNAVIVTLFDASVLHKLLSLAWAGIWVPIAWTRRSRK
ncbi:MAG TPA: hypothetical protein VH044_13710 [Polyangiaceae bacterium]|jgi:hypothetical protein|nr:hypothetical protein [Polyangiaceae bacterium]